MLVLTRRPGESFTIGEVVTVHFISFKGGQARIGIDAPKEVSVVRDDAIKREKERKE